MDFDAYTILDADTRERFSTKTYLAEHDGLRKATRERNRLALHYGKDFCLRVAGIDAQGTLHEIDEKSEMID
jgi:hypothetical protein